MATTKRRTPAKSSSRTRRSTAQRSIAELPGTDDIARAAKARPKTTAAIAAGLVTGIAAGVAGYFAFKRSGKTWDEFSNDIATGVKESAANVRTRVKDGIEDARTKAQTFVERRKDGVDPDSANEGKSQAMFAEEALTLKETGKKTKRPADATIGTDLNTGAIN